MLGGGGAGGEEGGGGTDVLPVVLLILEAALGALGEDAVPQHHLVQVLTHPALRIHLHPPTRHHTEGRSPAGRGAQSCTAL